MFRLSRYLKAIHQTGTARPPSSPGSALGLSGPVVIWNLIRRCNLTCKHCYSTSANRDFEGELTLREVHEVMDDLKAYGVTVLILSGGEPLMHPYLFEIAARAKVMGFYVGLSSNGTLIDRERIGRIAEIDFDYVGISLDGLREVHDQFRRSQGAFDDALTGVRLCIAEGIKVGLRYTLTRDNHQDLPGLIKLMREEGVNKFYLSHLNYAGRGNRNRKDDAHLDMTRHAMNTLIDAALEDIRGGRDSEFVTGNNDADAVFLLHWVRDHMPEHAERLHAMLRRWGGNSSGVNIANIDNLGNVHPDTMWWDYNLGSVRERPFSEIWEDTSEPLMRGLKQRPRPLEGRCGVCEYRKICGGNSRTRAWQVTGNPWSEDPGCYLDDVEIGVSGLPDRVPVKPWSRWRNAEALGKPGMKAVS